MDRIHSTLVSFTKRETHPYIQATSDNLWRAIEEKGAAIFNYQFRDAHSGKIYAPLALAVRLQDESSLQELVRLGADVDEPDLMGNTALHQYVLHLHQQENVDLVFFNSLLGKVKHINADNNEGKTALHLLIEKLSCKCSYSWYWIIAEKLFQMGANPLATDSCLNTPLMSLAQIEVEIDIQHYIKLQKGYLQLAERYCSKAAPKLRSEYQRLVRILKIFIVQLATEGSLLNSNHHPLRKSIHMPVLWPLLRGKSGTEQHESAYILNVETHLKELEETTKKIEAPLRGCFSDNEFAILMGFINGISPQYNESRLSMLKLFGPKSNL